MKYVIKNVGKLRATFQIRFLVHEAVNSKSKLILRVPSHCEFDRSLEELMNDCRKFVLREDS